MVTAEDGLYRCAECGLHYRDRATAQECEDYCREHNACNTDITVQAVDT